MDDTHWIGRGRDRLRTLLTGHRRVQQTRRIAMTAGCRDSDPIPKVPRAGAVVRRDGQRVQVMHEGSLVVADGYCGPWMTEIITRLRGHHEPQEELVFHHLLGACRPGTLLIEVGAYWAYYTNWWLGAVPGARAVCVEPDEHNMAIGRRNLALNGRTATWIQAAVGAAADAIAFRRESDGTTTTLPSHSLESLLDLLGRPAVEMLHVDCQGAELPFLASISRAARDGLVRFVVVSTHHVSISGSATTHGDCVRLLEEAGATILCEHTVAESFSGDGLIAASFLEADAAIGIPALSRNTPRRSLFGDAGGGRRQLTLVDTDHGTMVVDRADDVVAGHLCRHGAWHEHAVRDVVEFLRVQRRFRPGLFVDVGANIGVHVLQSLAEGLFPRAIGVEMDEANHRLLVANAALNGHAARVQLWNLACSDGVGEVVCERSPDNYGDHRVRIATAGGAAADDAYGESRRETRSVRATTLDALEGLSHTSFDDGTLVWIDVQGHEGHVMAGARAILARDRRPAFVLEFWPYGLERAGGRARLFPFLAGCRSIHDIGVPGWQTLPPVDGAALEARYDQILGADGPDRLHHTDLLCIV